MHGEICVVLLVFCWTPQSPHTKAVSQTYYLHRRTEFVGCNELTSTDNCVEVYDVKHS